MVRKKWSDLTEVQKTRGIAAYRAREDFWLKDENNEQIVETDTAFIKRIGEEMLYKTALGYVKQDDAQNAKSARTDL